ncbi:MAG: hypothetical protein VCB99_12530 [Myxococcota bacterium]
MRHEPETQASEDPPGMPFAPGGFAADAERERREGRLLEAEHVLRAGLEGEPDSEEGRLVLALVLLDRGLERAAQSELERLAERMLVGSGVGEASGPISESEIEAAMQRAEFEASLDDDPHGVASAIAREFSPTLEIGEGAGIETTPVRSAFDTRTMAEVLEEQGDDRGAAGIRERLAVADTSSGAGPGPAGTASGARAELERWLRNLRTRKDG